MILVDSCVLLDLIDNDPAWEPWSAAQITSQSLVQDLFVNPIVYAEIAPRFTAPKEVDRILEAAALRFIGIPRDAAFMAAKAHQQYRRQGGARTSLLPDFLIGAHAAVLGASILTRDTRRYATYFPMVRLIAP